MFGALMSAASPWDLVPSDFDGLIRSVKRVWFCAFSNFHGHATNVQMDLIGILQALRLAQSLMLQRVMCQTDSVKVYCLIISVQHDFQHYACYIQSICDLLENWP
ncbi:hypothetical protein RIF29_27614 [Crotalaria pallida]|uniref:RNase H type-1 domain-containing protein n=1 Tax=Crotalaria pallida TaxID=3830 RepID=A0AAN9ERK2_CROPI